MSSQILHDANLNQDGCVLRKSYWIKRQDILYNNLQFIAVGSLPKINNTSSTPLKIKIQYVNINSAQLVFLITKITVIKYIIASILSRGN